eukprot:CAMPEP_0181183484 /NCGR_PEP_ID=MMETSP1096-20121128/8452_1 /TAXON_ID=156174 ORGANISM="Chrysochromulina ericina, Strain CCMP281" /NCGR_SAMPLE_ID=MMETSP1096 /ASSEMBLY_ACC=CAM_ASM_000453 /LENGTH=547 /DNA_ID=CAMNT_0023272171 /DNA_START=1 /DNA_END=1645 /DNA_ORIENTATION=+
MKQQGELDTSSSHPFRSPRVTAGHIFAPKEDSLAAGTVPDDFLGYAAAREHGLSQGYHLFRTPPPPAAIATNKSAWYVNSATLKSAHGPAAYTLSAQQLQKRKAHVKALMRCDPANELKEQKKAVRRGVDALDEVDATLPGDAEALASATQALTYELEKYLETKDYRIKESLIAGLPLHEAAAEEGRAKAEVQSLLRSDLYDVTSELADKWAALQREGEVARRAALEKMVAKGGDIQEQMIEVELRLTDHVLMGTAEEAERMLRAAGPDGAQLRSLRQEGDDLIERQRKQKAVLVSVARKALDADAMHREEIAAYGRRLLAADKTHEALLGAVTGLKKTCGEVTTTFGVSREIPKEVEIAPPAPRSPTGTIERLTTRGFPAASNWQRLTVSIRLDKPSLGGLSPNLIPIAFPSRSLHTVALYTAVAFARDDDLPTVVDENGVVLKAPIKPPPGAIELSRALVAVRVAPEGPAAGKISSGDVLLSLNGRDSWKMSGYGDIRACMEELGGTESSWKPCQLKIELMRPVVDAAPAADTKRRRGRFGGLFG